MGHRTSRERLHSLPRRLGPALVVAACAFAGVRAMGEPSLLAKGTKAPAFEVVGAQGEKIAFPSMEFRGKVVVLDFWATWCPPCKASLPNLDALTRKLDASKVAVLAVCVSDDKDRFKTWVQNHPYAFKVAYDPAGRSAPSFANTQYRVNGIPATYILDREGKVADTIVGYTPGDKNLEAALHKLGIDVK